MDAIRIDNLTKKYKDVVAVNMLNLSVHRGELLSLLGVNGAGKTTTIKMLSCLTQPTSGDAFINGKSITNCNQSCENGAIVSVRGQGRFVFETNNSLSKKGKLRVCFHLYI